MCASPCRELKDFLRTGSKNVTYADTKQPGRGYVISQKEAGTGRCRRVVMSYVVSQKVSAAFGRVVGGQRKKVCKRKTLIVALCGGQSERNRQMWGSVCQCQACRKLKRESGWSEEKAI